MGVIILADYVPRTNDMKYLVKDLYSSIATTITVPYPLEPIQKLVDAAKAISDIRIKYTS